MKLPQWATEPFGQTIIATFLSLIFVVPVLLHNSLLVLPIILGVLPVCIYLILMYPYVVTILFVAFSFFRIHEVFPILYPFKIPQILGIGMLVGLFFNLLAKKVRIYWTREMTFFALFFAIVTVEIVFSTNRGRSWTAWSDTFSKVFLAFFCFTWLVRGKTEYIATALIIIICGYVLAIIAIVNKHTGVGLVENTRVTISGDIGSQLGDPNFLAMALLFPFSFNVSLFLTRGSRWIYRLFGLLGAVLVLIAILDTQSRGGLLGLLSVCCYFFYKQVKSKVLILAFGVSALIFFSIMANISGRVSGGSGAEGIDDSSMGRLYAWRTAINMVVRNPVTGIGLGTFSSNYYKYTSHWEGKERDAHSTWFLVLAETGLPGFFFFISCFVLAFRSVRHTLIGIDSTVKETEYIRVCRFLANSLFAGLIGFCVSGSFISQATTWPFYVLFALIISLGEEWRQVQKGQKINASKN